MTSQLLAEWTRVFEHSHPEVIVRAPGRVNIIGEHTDYNEGWVMPGAINHYVYLLVSPNPEGRHHWAASNLNETVLLDVKDGITSEMPLWGRYLHGAIHMYTPGIGPLLIMIAGDLPVGAGLSSSSALVCSMLIALHRLHDENETREDIAVLASRVEREIIGLQGGIMDQYAIMLSRADQVMLLDCRTRQYHFINAHLPGCRWLLINTKVKHELIDSDYNQRAIECKEAIVILQQQFPEIMSLRDVTIDMIDEVDLPETLYRRSKFIVEENQRVHAMHFAFENKDSSTAGRLLLASHNGLRDLYEVSCPELDHLIAFSQTCKGVYGARMMGGGFGGCVLCLVHENIVGNFLEKIKTSYHKKFGFDPEVIHFNLSAGAEIV